MDSAAADRAVPNLPSRDFDATEAFYRGFGFVRLFRDGGWMILRRVRVREAVSGTPRLHPVRMQDWGLRAGFLVDLDGTQLALIEQRD